MNPNLSRGRRVFAACALLISFVAFASESSRPFAREEARVLALFKEGKFAELEALEQRTRDLSVTLSDGQPARGAYFGALQCMCSDLTREERRYHLPGLKARVEEWRRAYPSSIAARLAEAGYYREVAWIARGEDYAHKVPAAAWPVYRENLATAARLLDSIGPPARDEPGWYWVRLQVARERSEPDRDYEKLLDEALERHPLYLPLYFEATVHASPKWGGSHAQLNAFIEEAVNRTSKWLGDTMYARLQWSNQTPTFLLDGQADWSRMKKGFERIVADYPDQWNLANFARFACIKNDMATLSQLMPRLGLTADMEVWKGMNFYSSCKLRAEMWRKQPPA